MAAAKAVVRDLFGPKLIDSLAGEAQLPIRHRLLRSPPTLMLVDIGFVSGGHDDGVASWVSWIS